MKPLESQGGIIGLMENMPFESSACDLGPFAEVLLFSDGVFEIERPDGTMWTFEEFTQFSGMVPPGSGRIDQLLAEARRLHGEICSPTIFRWYASSFDCPTQWRTERSGSEPARHAG